MNKEFQKHLKKISLLDETRKKITLAAFLTKLFRQEGVGLVVVGGAAVQYYTLSEFVTHDLDAVLNGDTKEIIEKVMRDLGFKRTTMYRHFEHPLFDFVVEFPPSPIEVASRILNKMNLVKTSEGEVQVVRVEDLIMDRITAAVEWKDGASLDQAKLMYVKHHKFIDQDYLTQFAKEEGYLKTLKEVMKVVEES